MRKNRRNGAWSEKLVTLTLPHRPEDGIADRIHYVREGWKFFRRAFKEWLAHVDHAADQVHWYAAHEWTAGEDRQGHPHIHFWFWGPFLDIDTVRELWRRALEKAGFGDLEADGRVVRSRYEGDLIVDIRRVKEGVGGLYEVIKYIVKDLEKGGRIDPRLYAQVYEALDGKRTQQGSSGLLKLGDREAGCQCGASGCFLVCFVERKRAPLASPQVDAREGYFLRPKVFP